MAEPAAMANTEQVSSAVLLSATPELAQALVVAKRLRSVVLRDVDEGHCHVGGR